tara:strand:- start:242 stop:433 length:192 start_codon:yes stop_codon:yes gene_type:complete
MERRLSHPSPCRSLLHKSHAPSQHQILNLIHRAFGQWRMRYAPGRPDWTSHWMIELIENSPIH